MESFLVGREQIRYNWPVEVCFVSLNNITLVGSATFCSFLKLSCELLCRYTVLYFLPKKSLLLLTNDTIKSLVDSQNGANIHTTVPISLYYLPINLYTSVADYILFSSLMEWALHAAQNVI